MITRVPDDWPDAIRDRVSDLLGEPVGRSRLGGMSGATVERLSGPDRTAILKVSTSPVEWHFYTEISGRVKAGGVDIPDLYAADRDDRGYWLLVEDVPLPLPADRHLADPEVMASLRRLHGIPVKALPLHPQRYRPVWTEDLTAEATSLLGAGIALRLEDIRVASQELFISSVLVSGDPNPNNWGLRGDGSPVLFDWERCTLATPEIDLAITVPGLGTLDDFSLVAARYFGPEATMNPEITRRLAVAKVWSVVEFLAGCASGSVNPTFELDALTSRVPEWLDNLGF